MDEQIDQEVVKGAISRRGFLKAGSAAVGTAVLGGVVAGCGDSITRVTKTGDTKTDTTDAWMTPPAPISDGSISSTVTADVIVIGSGVSGLTTAASAAENGAKVILITASKGTTFRGGSFHAANSKTMQKAGIPPYDVDIFFRRELGCASFNVDQDKWWKFYNNSEEAMNWLSAKMEAAGYTTVLEHDNKEVNDGPSNAQIGAHSWISKDMALAGLGAQFVVETLVKSAQASGAQVIYQMVAKQLVREGNNTGRVSAVIAQGQDGKYVKYVGTKAIVMATGDFSADKNMMTKYCPWAVPLLSDTGDAGYENNFKFGGLFKGDGQKMGLWIGAAWQKTFPNAPMIQGKWIASNQPYGAHRGLLVNKNGYRYGSEDVNGPYAGINQMHQPDMLAYAIWDSAYAVNGAPWYSFGAKEGDAPTAPADIVAGWESQVKAKAYVKGDSVDSVITQLGLPAAATRATIDHYNAMVAAGVDTDYHKRKALLCPITTGPFYGGVSAPPDFLTVLGGLRTNINLQVCDAKDQPIPGLFNVGTMVGDYYANCYNFDVAGNNYGGNCLTFGYLTGRAIAKGNI